MSTTTSQGFSLLASNLNISGLQTTTVSTRQQNVRDAVAEELTVLDSFLAGSYRRSTMIAPLYSADIDVFVVLDPSYYTRYSSQDSGQANLLDMVKRVVKKTYPNTPKISRNGQAVTIQFTDFQVDVVPAFHRAGGGYLIADSVSKRWIGTDPKKHIELFSTANSAHDGDLNPLIKMIKGWNVENGKYFRSFHLEVLALQILKNVRISNYPSGIRYFFDNGHALVAKQNLDPAGYGDDIGKYITATMIPEAQSRFMTGYKRAKRAEEAASEGKMADAYEAWKLIFGKYFPSYG
jgi:hypothetical protein